MEKGNVYMSTNDIRISVVIATYNGELYIEQQLDSIIKQLGNNDEIIVSDDGSTDDTREIVSKYVNKDLRVRLVSGAGKGVKKNFENGIKYASGMYIFLSDQDDVWMENKIEKVMSTFYEYGATCVLHDAVIVDKNLNLMQKSFFEYRNTKLGIVNNIIKNSYIGCCMAFSRNLVGYILPIPNKIEMHDQWIGIISEYYGKNIILDEKLISYRRHDKNVSKMERHNVYTMLKNRIIFVREYRSRINDKFK